MRWFFIVLVAANLVYFGWENYFRENRNDELSQQNKTVVDTAQGLKLLSEKGGAISEALPDSSVPDTGRGMLLGGYSQQARVEHLRQRLLALGVEGRIVERKSTVNHEYWVYMLPLSSRAATLRLVKELQARKFDAFLVNEGELANGVSLGVFPVEEAALVVIERLRLAGYRAETKKIPRGEVGYWYFVAEELSGLVDETLLKELTKTFPDIQIRVQE